VVKGPQVDIDRFLIGNTTIQVVKGQTLLIVQLILGQYELFQR